MTEQNLKVFDTSATSDVPVREHDIMFNGVIEKVKFNYGQPTVLPVEKALKFNKDGFIIKGMDDSPYEKPVQVDNVTQSRLAPGEVVAKLEELTTEALRIRVALKPNGEALAKAKKEELVEFLKGETAAAPVAATAKPAAGQTGETADGELDSEDGEAGGSVGEDTTGGQGSQGGVAFTE